MVMFGIGFQEIMATFFCIGFILLIGYAISNAGRNYPTWTGIIISAILNILVIYLILCFFGIMGEERIRKEE